MATKPERATGATPTDPLWPRGGRPLCAECHKWPMYLAALCGRCFAKQGEREREQ